MFANEDIYTGKTEPTATINPKIIGAFYINTSNATIYICKDNTLNKNKWVRSGYTLDEIWDYINPKLPKQQDMAFGDTYILDSTSYKCGIKYKNTTGYPMMLHHHGTANGESGSCIFDIWEPDGTITTIGSGGASYGDDMQWIVAANQSFRIYVTNQQTNAITCLRRR